MENDSKVADKSSMGLPQAKPFSPHSGDETKPSYSPRTATEPEGGALLVAAGSNDKVGVFQRLVKDDTDIAGLVAYSIYKQNKLDWLRAFESAMGRTPNDAEMASYIVGEGTPRRLATYRHLAEATLAGNGPDIDGIAGHGGMLVKHFGNSNRKALTVSVVASYAFIAILFVILFWLAARFTMSSR